MPSKFENRIDVIIEISRFSRHRRPGINEGVFDITCGVLAKYFAYLSAQTFMEIQ